MTQAGQVGALKQGRVDQHGQLEGRQQCPRDLVLLDEAQQQLCIKDTVCYDAPSAEHCRSDGPNKTGYPVESAVRVLHICCGK